MRLVTLLSLFPKNADQAARKKLRFLIRWAAQSARISEVGTPQTFSVYDLKNWLKSHRPNRLATHSSYVFSSPFGFTAAQRYEKRALVRSTGPSFFMTSGPRSG